MGSLREPMKVRLMCGVSKIIKWPRRRRFDAIFLFRLLAENKKKNYAPPPFGHLRCRADCGNLPEDWGVANVADLTNLTKIDAKTALQAYGKFVQAVYHTTIE